MDLEFLNKLSECCVHLGILLAVFAGLEFAFETAKDLIIKQNEKEWAETERQLQESFARAAEKRKQGVH